MNKKFIILSIFLAFTSMQTFALTEQEAVEVFWEQFNKKPDNGITSLSRNCVFLIESGLGLGFAILNDKSPGIGLNLREEHNEECGGGPGFAHSIAFFWVSEEKELWIMDFLSDDWRKMEEFEREKNK